MPYQACYSQTPNITVNLLSVDNLAHLARTIECHDMLLHCLQPGKGVLKVSYTGELNDKMKGFYRSKYTMPDGQERFGAVTQFEVLIVTLL